MHVWCIYWARWANSPVIHVYYSGRRSRLLEFKPPPNLKLRLSGRYFVLGRKKGLVPWPAECEYHSGRYVEMKQPVGERSFPQCPHHMIWGEDCLVRVGMTLVARCKVPVRQDLPTCSA